MNDFQAPQIAENCQRQPGSTISKPSFQNIAPDFSNHNPVQNWGPFNPLSARSDQRYNFDASQMNLTYKQNEGQILQPLSQNQQMGQNQDLNPHKIEINSNP